MTSFLLLTFLTSHGGIVSSFFHSLYTADFASGIFIACGKGINLCTKLWWFIEFYPLPAKCSSWILFVTDSVLCLVDSCASVIQLNLVLASDALVLSVFETTVSRVHAWENALLHGIAAAFDVSNCCLVFFLKKNDVFVFFITRNTRINSFQSSGMFEFLFLDCPLLFFSSLSGFSNVIWTWCRLEFCQSSPGSHISLWRSFVQ